MTQPRSESAAQTPPTGCPAHTAAVPLYGPRFQTDPAQLYQEVRREHGPVVPVDLGGVSAWLVIGYRELQQVTDNTRLFGRNSVRWNAWEGLPADWPLRPMVHPRQSILYAEDDAHQRLADAVSDSLAGVDPYELRSHCEEIADRLIDDFAGVGEADLVSQYANLMPAMVLARIFGMPDDEIPALVRNVNTMLDGGPDAIAGQDGIIEASIRLLGDKRLNPGADVTSRLLGHAAGLADEEAMQDLSVLLTAGHQPTANWLANALRLMLTDDRFAASLTGGRRSIGQALNEVLWEDTPIQNFAGRWATADTQLGGQRIKEGDMLILGLAAVNADPLVRSASGAPHEGSRAHLSFSHGAHRCPFPAQEIAETIATTGVEVLLDRLPDVELSIPEQALVWRPSPFVRGLAALPAGFTPTHHTGGSR